MRYWQCKCGKSQAFGSDSPPVCSGCSYCGTGFYGVHPDPHEYKTMYNEHTGIPYERCNICNQKRENIEKIYPKEE